MPRYDNLALTALQTNRVQPFTRPLHTMRFPGAWRDPLRQMMRAKTRKQTVSIPVASLNAAITALVPDCVTTWPGSGQGDADADWIFAYTPVEPVDLFSVVAAWVRAQALITNVSDDVSKVLAREARTVLDKLSAGDLTWTSDTVDRQADVEPARRFHLLPMEAAAALTEPGVVCPYGDLVFRRTPAAQGAELMSWPPLGVEKGFPYSIVITLTAQTLPFDNEARLHVRFGLRQWAGHQKPFLSHRDGHSVYMAPRIPYLAGTENSGQFGKVMIRRQFDRETKEWGNRWDDSVADVLTQAGCLDTMPDPGKLVDDPIRYIQADDPAALVVRKGMLAGKQNLEGGLSIADHVPLMNWVAGVLAPTFGQVAPLPREKTKVLGSIKSNLTSPVPPDHIAAAIDGDRLDIDILTDTDAVTDEALRALCNRLGTDVPSPNELKAGKEIKNGQVMITLRRVRESALLSDLHTPSGRKDRQSAVRDRISQVTKTLQPGEHPTIALVEIAPRTSYEDNRREAADPKAALRHGLLSTGRLSQFVNPIVETSNDQDKGTRKAADAEQRLMSSVNDLFRQLGVAPEPLPNPLKLLGVEPAFLGIWLIRRNKSTVYVRDKQAQLPIAVLVSPSGAAHITAPGVDWVPYHRGLLQIGRQYMDVSAKLGQDDILQFIQQVLADSTRGYPGTLLLTEAINLRTAWPALTNTNLHPDTVAIGNDSRPISEYSGLRHVRVRTSGGAGETPLAYGVAENGETGQASGLWKMHPPRVFASTSGKPATASSTLKGLSKIVPWRGKEKEQPPNPWAKIWNPQVIELCTTGLQDGDNPAQWAALAHELRHAAPYVRDTTVLPWPLHLAKQVEEYIVMS